MSESKIPPAPREARELFSGEAWPVIQAYAGRLAGPGVERGLIGPREVDRLWERHLLNCGVIAETIPDGKTVVDIGSGAGLPGIVLGILRPDLAITLLEPLLRRSVFLNECIGELRLANLEILRARAEELKDKRFDIATARAVAPLDRLARWAVPLLNPYGELLAMKGERGDSELEAAAPVLRRLGVKTAEIVTVGHGKVDPPTRIIRVVAGSR